MKLGDFDDHLKEKLKDPICKAGFEAWGNAIEEEIKPRDARIERLEKALKKFDKSSCFCPGDRKRSPHMKWCFFVIAKEALEGKKVGR